MMVIRKFLSWIRSIITISGDKRVPSYDEDQVLVLKIKPGDVFTYPHGYVPMKCLYPNIHKYTNVLIKISQCIENDVLFRKGEISDYVIRTTVKEFFIDVDRVLDPEVYIGDFYAALSKLESLYGFYDHDKRDISTNRETTLRWCKGILLNACEIADIFAE
jgi:hypothetical protein